MMKRLKMKMMVAKYIGVALMIFSLKLQAQLSDTLSSPDTRKLKSFIIISGTAYTATLIGLNELWYKDSDRQSFSFFNDNNQWKQLDKAGHFFSAFHLSTGTSKGLQWCNVSKGKSDLWGSVAGFLILLPIEIFDGFSADYGASPGDLLANALGSGFFLGQNKLWDEVRIHPKFSFQRTNYPALRTDNILGNSLITEIFKDYNGQTYWLSFDIDKFMRFPKWLNIVAGYGATGMVYATTAENSAAGYEAFRQYYLGIDFDLSHIKTRSKALNTLLFFVNMVKLPAPAIRYSGQKISFHAFAF